MRNLLVIGAIAVLMTLSVGPTVEAKDIVINDAFNLPGWGYWLSSGNPHAQWVDYYNVSGAGASYCIAQYVSTGYSGGLTQSVFVVQGVTYDVVADFAYANC